MFELTKAEFDDLRCQIDTSRWVGTMPYAFTEQGIQNENLSRVDKSILITKIFLS